MSTYVLTSWIRYGILNGFSEEKLNAFAEIYNVKIVKSVVTSQGFMTRLDFRAEGSEKDLKNFTDALRSLNTA